jgi:hypothetical protein
MPYVAAIGHRLSLVDLLEKFDFEDFDEAESMLEEAGLSLFENESEDVFVIVTDKFKIIYNEKYIDLNLSLTEDEEKLLSQYTGCCNKRIKLFWIADEIDGEGFLEIQAFIESKREVSESFDII